MHLVIGIMFLIGWMLCIRQPVGKDNIFGKPIRPFYQISEGLYTLTIRGMSKSDYLERLKNRLKILYPSQDEKQLVRQYICYKLSLVLVIIGAATLISFCLLQNEAEQSGIKSLERENYWGTEKEEVLQVETEGLEEQEIKVLVSERKYSNKELTKILKKMAQSLEKTILGDNESLDCVTSDLNLVSEIPDTQVEVLWEMDTDAYIQYGGILVPDAVTEAGAIVNLTATLSYEDVKYQHSFAVHLQKPKLSEQEQLKEQLAKELQYLNVSTAGAQVLELPDEIQGKEVLFSYPQESYGYKLFLAMVICGILVFFLKDENLQKDLDIRNQQMLLDYSEIVSKLTLLLGAGLTIRSALEKIASDYDKKCRQKEGGRRFAYEEILYVCREMQGGISERQGIDMLGKRCQIPCYMKLCSLLLQNLKKGSRGMAESLGYEVGQAFEERKNAAKRLGEEAGTKLLIPMILMLVIVMAVLIIPAFLSM